MKQRPNLTWNEEKLLNNAAMNETCNLKQKGKKKFKVN